MRAVVMVLMILIILAVTALAALNNEIVTVNYLFGQMDLSLFAVRGP